MLAHTPCPRCGCYLTRYFECGCGAVHDDYCVNCGRWVSLPPTEHVELSEVDVRCDAVTVPHDHPETEKAERVREYVKTWGSKGSTR